MTNDDTTITIEVDTSQAERGTGTLLAFAHPVNRRVDAWLEAHREWIAASADRQKLRMQWRACAQWFGAESDPARGVLLGLVRLAWGDPRAFVGEYDAHAWAAYARGQMWTRGTEAEALLAALEVATCL